MVGGLSHRRLGRARVLVLATALAAATWAAPSATFASTAASTTASTTPAPAPSSTPATPAPDADAAPAPAYPTATDGPSRQRDPYVAPEDEGEANPGNFTAADGRVIPTVGWLTESIDQAVLWKLRPRVDQRRLINMARGLPLDGRKIMLTVDEAEPGATRDAMLQDAEATADVMVGEYREGMPLDNWQPGSETRPRLDAGWIMLTVMLRAADTAEDTAQGPVTVLELGQGVSLASEDSAALIERAGHTSLGEGDLTDGLDEIVRTAVDQTVPPPAGAGLSWTSTSLSGGQAALLAVLVAGLAAVAVVPRVLTSRRRRAVTAHAAQPGWYADTDGDPALRLRRIVETLGLALDAPGARALPSAAPALAALVEHTLELDRVAPRSRTGKITPGWQTRRNVLEVRVREAEQLLVRLLDEGEEARPAVRFAPEARQVAAEGGGRAQKPGEAGR